VRVGDLVARARGDQELIGPAGVVCEGPIERMSVEGEAAL
jgi:hypothetical protein